jgi:hypothetical protein
VTMSAPEDDDLPDSMSPQERREHRHFERHRVLFMVGLGFGTVGMLGGASHPIVEAVSFVIAALSWGTSGVYAITGRRHMFGAMSGGAWWGAVGVRPAVRSPIAATLVGVILIGLAAGLVNVGFQLTFR